MKICKLLTICLVVCSLFVVPQLKAETVGIAISISGEFQGTDTQALFAQDGDVIDYIVTVTVLDVWWSVSDADIFIKLPNGTEIQLANDIFLASPSTTTYDPAATYTVNAAADLGSLIGADDNEIRARARVVGTSNRPGSPQGVEAALDFDTLVLNPDVCVTKSVDCDLSAPGYEVDYTIQIKNCGDDPLRLVSIIDSLATPAFEGDDPNFYEIAIAAGCEFLYPGSEPNSYCEITYSLGVLEEDLLPEPNLVNDVNVIYSVIGTGFTVQDMNDVVVDLIDPNFTVMKECVDEPIMVGADANFLVTIENIGTADLILASDEFDIEPNLLPEGEFYYANVTQTVESCDDARNTVFVEAILPPDLCFALDEPLVESASASCEVIDPNFTVEKNCLNDPVPADANAMFEIIITNTSCGEVVLFFDVNDPAAPHINGSYGPISPLGTVEIPIELPADCEVDESIINIVYVEAFYDSNSIGEKEAEAECPVEPCGGDEGCTPGYWKNSPDCWCDAYIGNPKLCTIFDLNCDTTPNDFFEKMGQKKMMAALSFKGGSKKKYKFRILLKHAVAALLNACNDDVNYPVSESYIIDSVDHIINNWGDYSKSEILSLKNEFDTYNNLGCPISADNAPEGIACERHDD